MDLVSGYEQGSVVGACERGNEPSIPKVTLSTEQLLGFQGIAHEFIAIIVQIMSWGWLTSPKY